MNGDDDMPTYQTFMLPTLQAVDRLGGSASVREIRDAMLTALDPPEELLSKTYERNGKSKYVDRMDWARSYCKLSGLLESPKRGLFVLTDAGREVLQLGTDEARERLRELDRQVRQRRARGTKAPEDEGADGQVEDIEGLEDELEGWRDELLQRLHTLSPTAFERFVLYLLRLFDLELDHVGGSGDLGLDGIGTAPLTPVLSATVAVQVKRYDPGRSVGRDPVALFQRDSAAAGAERAIFVTLGRFTRGARQASQATTPTVDLIDGDKLCELILEKEAGVVTEPVVKHGWFTRFEDSTN